MDGGSERSASELMVRHYTPCYLPSSISVEVPSEAAVGRPFDVTLTPSFEMTPEQIEDYNDLYDTGFESARDMWESACDSERASYYIITPATYKPSGKGVSYVIQHTVSDHYPPYNYYLYHADRKFDLGGDPTTIQMTIDEPIIFRVSDIDDRGNQDYFKFDFGAFKVEAGTHPVGTLGPPRTVIYTYINGDRIRLSDSEFASVRGASAEPGPDDQLIPTTEGAGGSFMRPMRDGETTSLYDFPFWRIAEDPWGFFRHDAGPVAAIERLGLGEEYLENFLNAYPEFKSSTRVSGASAHQSEPVDSGSSAQQDQGVGSDVPFEWFADLLDGDFRGDDPAELIKRFGLDDAYVTGFLDAYPQYGTRVSGVREPASRQPDAAGGAQSSRPNLAFVTGKITFNDPGTATAVHGVKACA